MLEPEEHFGPAMARLNRRQRDFVYEFCAHPKASHAAAARRAGYSDAGGGAKVRAHHLLRDERILAAIRETLEREFRADAVLGRSVLVEIAENPEHPASARIRAAEALLARGGFAQEQRITVEHKNMSEGEMIARIKQIARELNLDEAQVLGWAEPPKLIEAVPVETEPGPDR
jgi:phage terminase small subunit